MKKNYPLIVRFIWIFCVLLFLTGVGICTAEPGHPSAMAWGLGLISASIILLFVNCFLQFDVDKRRARQYDQMINLDYEAEEQMIRDSYGQIL